MAKPKKYTCPLCGVVIKSGSRLHWSKFHNDISYEQFMALCSGIEVPRCKFCGRKVYWDSKHSRFSKVCSSKECKERLKHENGLASGKRLAEHCKQTGKGLWNPETLKKSHETQRQLGIGFWNSNVQSELSRRSNLSQIGNPNAFKKFRGNSNGRLYISKVLDKESGTVCCKIGIGNPWRRWACILLLNDNLELLELKETNIIIHDLSELEVKVQSVLLEYSLRTVIPRKGLFSEREGTFIQGNGFTEWYVEEAFDKALEYCQNNYIQLIDTTEGFREFYESNEVKLVSSF